MSAPALFRVLAIARKEAALIRRDRQLFLFQILMPLLVFATFGGILSAPPTGVPLRVWDNDGTAAARDLVRRATSTGRFRAEVADAATVAAHGEALATLIIPPGYGRELKRGHGPAFTIQADGTEIAAARAAQGLAEQLIAPEVAPAPSLVSWYNPDRSLTLAYVPSVLGVILSIFPATLSCLSLVKERECGAWPLLEAAPATLFEMLAGKLLLYTGQAAAAAALTLGAAILAFGVPVRGSFVLLLSAMALMVATGLALGVAYSAKCDTEDRAWSYLNLYTLTPAFVFSGFFYPVSGMPAIGQAIAYLSPPWHFLVVLRAVLLKGAGPAELLPHLGALAAFAAGSAFLAVRALRPPAEPASSTEARS